jgi:hypothetical protein
MDIKVKIVLAAHAILLATAYALIWGVYHGEQSHVMEFNTAVESASHLTVLQGTMTTVVGAPTTTIECKDVERFISTLERYATTAVYATLSVKTDDVQKTYRAVVGTPEPTVIDLTCGFPPGNGFGHFLPESYTGNQVTLVEDNTVMAAAYSLFTLVALAITLFFSLALV